jgi:hypothetical protein
MSSSISTPASSSITRDIEGLLASVRNRIENTKVAAEPQSGGEVEAMAGMSATLREGSAEVIDMRRSWIEGPKGKKVSEVFLKTSGEANVRQYLRLQMRYNIDGSNVFVAYRNASLADSEDDTNWRNARASEKACATCVKRKNTCLRRVIDVYGDVDLGACVWCQERSVRCSIAQRGRVGKTSGEKRKKKAEGSSDEEDSSDEEPLVKKAKVAEVVAEDTPVPQLGTSEVDQPNEVEDRVEGEAEQPRVAEGLGQGAREARPDEAALVVALRELTEVCRRGFDDMREGLAELREDSWLLRIAAVEYLEERRRKNLNRLGDWAREREESSEGGSEYNYDWA